MASVLDTRYRQRFSHVGVDSGTMGDWDLGDDGLDQGERSTQWSHSDCQVLLGGWGGVLG